MTEPAARDELIILPRTTLMTQLWRKKSFLPYFLSVILTLPPS